MSWQWLDPRIIRHTDGHTIELKSGSWKIPMDIDPRFVLKPDSVTSARLIRTGLEFAALNTTDTSTSNITRSWKNPSDDKAVVAKPSQRTRPVLTLKKEKEGSRLI